MIRPEALAFLMRHRGLLGGLVLAALAIGLLRQPGYVVPGLGALLLATLGGLGLIALRRARFAQGTQGPGVVQVVEGQISFFGPEEGGFIGLDELTRLWLSGDGQIWLIGAEDGRILRIPRAARGAEALFDTFAALDGLDMPALLRALHMAPGPSDRLIWRRRTRALLT